MSDSILVKVLKVPGTSVALDLPVGSTVSDALAAAGTSAEGFTISVGTTPADMDTVLSDAARVVLSKSAKNNG